MRRSTSTRDDRGRCFNDARVRLASVRDGGGGGGGGGVCGRRDRAVDDGDATRKRGKRGFVPSVLLSRDSRVVKIQSRDSSRERGIRSVGHTCHHSSRGAATTTTPARDADDDDDAR